MKKIFIITVLVAAILVGGGFIIKKQFIKKEILQKENLSLPQDRIIKSVSLKTADETNFMLGFAQDKGFLKKHNLEVENVVTDGNASQLMVAGEADIYIGGMGGVLNDFLNDMDMKWIENTTNHPYNMIGVSRFPKGEETKIKKVAITRMGGGNQLQAMDALQKLGIDSKQIEFVAVPIASRGQMMQDGEIDFTVLDADFSGKSELYQKLSQFTIYGPDEIFSSSLNLRGIATTSKALSEKPAALKDFALTMKEMLEYIDGHKEETVQYLKTKFGFSADNANEFYENYQAARKDVDPKPNAALIQPSFDLIKTQFKVLNPDRDINQFIDTSLLK